MDDLISRAEAIRIASGYCHPANIADELRKLPPAQPEIIYCKDCKFTDGEKPIADGRYWCVLHSCFMHFCSDAERRNDD